MKAIGMAVWLAMALSLHAFASARAETRVTVVETHPSGDSIVLGPNQNLYVRLRYATDRPVRIWVRPYLRGAEANAGSSPSNSYTGTGEALGWFFLMRAGDEADELRVTAGDGSRDGTHEVARYPVRVIARTQPAVGSTAPEWVVALKRQSELAAKQAYDASPSMVLTTGESVFFGGFMLAVLGVSLSGFIAPAWAIWRWRGGWRVAATVPAVMLGFVLLRIVIDVSADPTSHNLWPFEVAIAALLSVGVTAALFAARRFESERG
jgi:hypothetical protein